jgi:hypothetical protein
MVVRALEMVVVITPVKLPLVLTVHMAVAVAVVP